MLDINTVIDEVCDLLSGAEDADYIGEPVSQLTHSLQAAYFAHQAGAGDELVLGALFHDIGHQCAPPGTANMDGLGIVDHEEIGAQWLSVRGFSSTVCDLVRYRVAAKRYQVYRRPKYHAALSEASLGTLAHQGGPMSPSEAQAFETHPLFKAILAVRTWDERAKEPSLHVPTLDAYRARMRTHLQRGRP